MKNQHIGIFPGVFDPVHEGHLAFASAALTKCNLDLVVFIPEPSPWQKHHASPIEDRLAMLRLVTAGQQFATLRPATERFTVTSLLGELGRYYPDAAFSLLVGSDVIQTSLPSWQDIDVLLATMSLIVGLRGSDTAESVSAHLADTPNAVATYLTTPTPTSQSTAIRNGQRTHPHPGIAGYIQEKELYI